MRAAPTGTRLRGVSLVEAVVAISVLAVAIPLALAAMTKAGDVSEVARAETRAPAIADYVKMELEQARRSQSEIFGSIPADVVLTESDGGKPLGFARDGSYIGVLTKAEYDAGVRRQEGREDVFYVAKASSREDERGLVVTVRISYPAVRSAEKRSGVSFHTLLP